MRQYFCLVAYPPHVDGDPNRRRRERFVLVLKHRLARRLPPEQRPDEVRHPPRPREIDAAVMRGHRRCIRAVGAAWGAVCGALRWPDLTPARFGDDPSWERPGVTYAAVRLADMLAEIRIGEEGQVGSHENILRRSKRARPVLHLALPLLQLYVD